MYDPVKEAQIDELVRQAKNRVYKAVVVPYEEAERQGLIVGNGHHMAQELAEQAEVLLRARYAKAQESVSEA